jgi:hypothetical protein
MAVFKSEDFQYMGWMDHKSVGRCAHYNECAGFSIYSNVIRQLVYLIVEPCCLVFLTFPIECLFMCD